MLKIEIILIICFYLNIQSNKFQHLNILIALILTLIIKNFEMMAHIPREHNKNKNKGL